SARLGGHAPAHSSLRRTSDAHGPIPRNPTEPPQASQERTWLGRATVARAGKRVPRRETARSFGQRLPTAGVQPVWQPDSRSSEGPSGQVYGRAGSRAAPARTARTPVGSCPGAHWPPRRAATPELPHTRSRSPAWTPKERVRE